MDGKQEVIIDMPDNSDMKNDAFTQVCLLNSFQAKFAIETLKVESKISQHLKNYFDSKYGPCWHCVAGIILIYKIGKSFHSYVSHETKHFIFFYEGQMAILIYKMG